MNVKLLTDYYLEFLNLKISCTSSPESTLVKTPHCRKSHVAAHINMINSLWHAAKTTGPCGHSNEFHIGLKL